MNKFGWLFGIIAAGITSAFCTAKFEECCIEEKLNEIPSEDLVEEIKQIKQNTSEE